MSTTHVTKRSSSNGGKDSIMMDHEDLPTASASVSASTAAGGGMAEEEEAAAAAAVPAANNSTTPTQRRSKREKYSPSRFVARPAVCFLHGKEDAANEEEEDDAVREEDGKPPPQDSQTTKSNTSSGRDSPRRRTSRAHAAPKSYEEPPDEFVDSFSSEDDDEDEEEEEEEEEERSLAKKMKRGGKRTSTNNNNSKNTKKKKAAQSTNTKVAQSTTTSYSRNGFQISSIKRKNPKKGRTLCNVVDCPKSDQVGNDGFCRAHYNLIVLSHETEKEEKEEEGEIEEYIDPTKPRVNSTIRITYGEHTGMIGTIVTIKRGGWCTLSNVTNGVDVGIVRMSAMELIEHNDDDGGAPFKRGEGSSSGGVKRSPRKREVRGLKRKSDDMMSSPTRGRGGGRPVRDRKKPTPLLSSPVASSSRRSKRLPKALGSFDDDDEDHDEGEEEEEEVRPRGRRGRSATATTNTPQKKVHSSAICKTPNCTKHSQTSKNEYCATCFKQQQRQQQRKSTTPQRGGSASRICQVKGCNKYNQWYCQGYCARHYRQYVVEGGEEEEEDVTNSSPPKKRARRSAIEDDIETEEVNDDDDDDNDDESPFDDPPRLGGSGRHVRYYCKVKKCNKWSQGKPKLGMCNAHYTLYRDYDDGTRKKSKKGSGAGVADGVIGVGSLVMVKERRGVGMNKPGGVGTVTKVYNVLVDDVEEDDDDEGGEVTLYDVKYVLGGREKGVDSKSLWLHDINAKSPTKPPPGFGGEDDDAVMLDEDDESIEDDELEGYEEFSLGDLEVPSQSVLDQRAARREELLDERLLGLDRDEDDHDGHLQENWKCAKCGGFNRPSAKSRCSTCQSYRVEENPSEDALLERTRYELLNGNDFWICTTCVIGVPSLLMPCGRCHQSISFVPLTMPEFEDFVRKQRQITRKREEKIQQEWSHKLEEVTEEWEDRKEKEEISSPRHQNGGVWTQYPCKALGCKDISAPNCEGFCADHFRTVIIVEEPEAYPVVRPEDKPLISEYFYLTYDQFRPCVLQDWERTSKQKDNHMGRGHPGIACKHCFGRENPTLRSMGRYFPSKESSLYQQTFTTNCAKHLLECAHCPKEVSLYPFHLLFTSHNFCSFSFHMLLCRSGPIEVDFYQERIREHTN